MNSFFMSEFPYYPLNWMFNNRAMYNKINQEHKHVGG